MVPMARITFQALLNWFQENNAERWYIHVQASQFDPKEYMAAMSPLTGMIVLNISGAATRDFTTDDDGFSFKSRIKGKEVWLEIPYSAVLCAIDPVTGIPNLFPYFEDYGDPEPESHIFNLPSSGLDVKLAKPTHGELLDISKAINDDTPVRDVVVLEADEDGVIRANFRQKNDGDTNKSTPFFTLEDLTSKSNLDLFQQTGSSNVVPLIEKDSVQTKVLDRKWAVIKGGKTVEPKASMPFIDHIYREKQERRKAKELAEDRYKFGNEMVSTAPLRSDGSEGKSVFFPDLDVSKVVWPPKKIARPDWMTVINGDKV